MYTRDPAEFGKENILICSASLFFPPDISIQLMRNGVELPDSKESDLVFKDDWRFHVTKHAVITPVSGEDYSCKITHGTHVNNHHWGEFGSARVCVPCPHREGAVRKTKRQVIQPVKQAMQRDIRRK